MQINIIGNHFAFMDSAMLLHIPAIFTAEEVSRIRAALEQAEWADGKATAGYQSAKAKHNLQLPQDHPLAREIGEAMLQRLWNHPCSCPPPCRSRSSAAVQLLYRRGSFDFHIDNAVRDVHGGRERVRTDLSSTLFFSDPEDYDGGELVIQDTYGLQQVKLPAGDLVLYPAPACTRSIRSPAARATPRSSGPRAWSAKTASAPCYSKWTSRSSDSPTTCPTILADPPNRHLPQSPAALVGTLNMRHLLLRHDALDAEGFAAQLAGTRARLPRPSSALRARA